MSTTVNYKGNTIATLSNETKTLTTAGTWVEGNIEIIDAKDNQILPSITQDQDGYIVLDDEAGESIQVDSLSVTQNGTYTASHGHAYSPVNVNVASSGGLIYESGTFTPASNTYQITIPFNNTHTEAPIFFAIYDATGTTIPGSATASTVAVMYADFYKFGGTGFPISTSTASFHYGLYATAYVSATGTSSSTVANQLTVNSDGTSNTDPVHSKFWATETAITGYSSTSRYFKTNRTYKWIAVWKPAT